MIHGKMIQDIAVEEELNKIYDEISRVAVNGLQIKEELPAASSSLLGAIYLYNGETDETYTNGYVYKCVSRTNYSAVVTFNPAKISVDGVDFIDFVRAMEPATYMTIASGKMTYYTAADLWSLDCLNADGETVLHYQQYTDDWEALGFTFTGEFQDEEEVAFTCVMTPVSVSYIWTRLDIQPNTSDYLKTVYGYSASTTQTLKHDANGFKWVNG